MDPNNKYEIFPEFYGADTENWLSLNCEMCSEALAKDFKDILGCQPSAIVNVIEFIIQMKLDDWELPKVKTYYEQQQNPVYAQFV